MEHYMLSDGYEMPKIGLETFQMKPEEAEAAAASTLTAGYRHIDTANICMNERAVGRAIKRSGIDRDEIFVSSKLWPSVCRAGAEAIDATHSRLDTDYLDMLILHKPAGGYVRAWKAMEDAYAQGKIRTLGLSISPKWLRTSGITAGIPVAAPLHHMDERLMHPEDRGTRWRRAMQAD